MDVESTVEEAQGFFSEGLGCISRIRVFERRKKEAEYRGFLQAYIIQAGLDKQIAQEHSQMREAFDATVALCDEVLAVEPQHYQALKLKGMSLFHMEYYHSAPEVLLAALEIRESQDLLWQLGRSLVEQTEYAEALKYVDRLLQKNPRHQKGLLVACDIGEATKDYGIAIEALQILRALNPNLSEYRNRLYQLLNWKMKPPDLVAIAYPTCKKCGKGAGWDIKGSVLERASCRACGAEFRVSTSRIRKKFMEIPPLPAIPRPRSQQRRRSTKSRTKTAN